MLILPIKKKWFDMIASGEKLEEYREISEYYGSRFGKMCVGDGAEHYVWLRNGYGKHRPTIMCKVTIHIDYGKTEWGAEQGVKYFVLRIISAYDITLPKFVEED